MEYTYEFLRKCHGLRFRAKSYGVPEEGIVKVDDAYVLLCYGKESLNFPESFNRRVTRMVDEEMPVIDSDFTDFEIIPRDPETYKDWQVGDKIAACTDDKGGEVIFRSGKLVICKDKNDGRAAGPFTCEELFEDVDSRLVLTDIEKQIIEEKKKKSEWKPQDGDICYVDAMFAEWVFIKKGDTCKTDTCACMNLGNDCVDLIPGHVTTDDRIYELRPATEEEKRMLFDAMSKDGKRWNAEKKVVEDIPKPYEFRKGEPVLVRNYDDGCWMLAAFSKKLEDVNHPYEILNDFGNSYTYRKCIPYNEKTMHLLGTNDDYEEEDK